MKKIIRLFSVVCVLGLFSACSSDDENDDDVARSSSSGGKTGTAGSTAVGGASNQTGGTSAVGGTSTETGDTQAVAGSTSTGGVTSVAGSSSTAGSTSVGGTSNVAGSSSTSTGGSFSTGGTVSTSPAVGLLSCALTRKGNEEYVSFVIKHHRETSNIKTVTFYGNCGVATTSLSGWLPICSNVSCDNNGDCLCETFIQKGSYLQLNIDRGPYVWAVGTTGNDQIKCPNNWDPKLGCLGKEDLIQNGLTYIGDQLLDVPEAVRNPQGTGYNYLVQVL